MSGCADPSAVGGTNSAERGDRPIRIVATVGMVGDLVKTVGGDRVEVVQLCGPGVDPHLYKATRDDVLQLLRADLIFYSGLMLEGKLADSLRRLSSTKSVVPVAERIEPNKLLGAVEGDSEGDSQSHQAYDPHVWMDASLWKEVLSTVADTLSTYDPPNSNEYKANAMSAQAEFERLHTYGLQVIQSIPASSRVLITSHDAFGYFGRAYGLEVQGVQGLSTESEGGLLQINRLVDLIVERKIKAVFVESSVSRKSIDSLVEGAKARGQIVQVSKRELFSDAMGTSGTYEGTYLGMMDHNLTIVASDLGGEAPPQGFQGKLSP